MASGSVPSPTTVAAVPAPIARSCGRGDRRRMGGDAQLRVYCRSHSIGDGNHGNHGNHGNRGAGSGDARAGPSRCAIAMRTTSKDEYMSVYRGLAGCP